jgi:succinate dehydrogenase / fumarate reductase, cytochrome b subunit
MFKEYISSSIGKKQIVAVSGLALILFLIFHLSGNLLLYKGPEAFNAYADFLQSLGNIKYIGRIGLIVLFVTHMFFTFLVVKENIKARGKRYDVSKPVGKRSLATKLMPLTGTFILVYLAVHLLDYTLADHHTVASMVNGEDLGLYGLVLNSFQETWRVVFYVLAMGAIGMHLVHAIQSVCQTFGFNHPVYSKIIKRVSLVLGVMIAVGFASIPLFINFVASCAASSSCAL